MKGQLLLKPFKHECGTLNLNTHIQQGSHRVCQLKSDNDQYYFDSFGEPPPIELLTYRKTSEELNDFSQSVVTLQFFESKEYGWITMSNCLKNVK